MLKTESLASKEVTANNHFASSTKILVGEKEKVSICLIAVDVQADQMGGELRSLCIKIGCSEPTRAESQKVIHPSRELSGDVIHDSVDVMLESDWLTT